MPDFVIGDVNVPDVVGELQTDAIDALETDYFIVDVVSVTSPTIANGIVVSQTPAANAAAPGQSTVTIYVSSGPALGTGEGVASFIGRGAMTAFGVGFGSRSAMPGRGTMLAASNAEVLMGPPALGRVTTEEIYFTPPEVIVQ